jgi:hypothetical protein
VHSAGDGRIIAPLCTEAGNIARLLGDARTLGYVDRACHRQHRRGTARDFEVKE